MSNPYSTPTADMASFANGAETYEPKLFATNGRIGRIRYLAYSSILMLLGYLVFAVLGFALAAVTGPAVVVVLAFVIFVPVIYLAFMMAKRRLHDLDKSGWWFLLTFIPLVGAIFSLYMLFARGSQGTNQYGPAPTANSTGLVLAGLVLPIIMFVGILAAVAIPAYQDYVQRAQEAQAAESVEAVEDSGE